jgi:hypothetical protein
MEVHERSHVSGMDRYLKPTFFLNWDHPEVTDLAARLNQGIREEGERARRLFYFVRDQIRYDPYVPFDNRTDYQAHIILRRQRGYCIQKAIVLATLARACGIPSRLRFADVRNHLVPPRLAEIMETDLFYFHGYDELFLHGTWVKVPPTFDLILCRRLGLMPVEFDGFHEALLHSRTSDGRFHVNYARQRGHFEDFPYEEVLAGFKALYGPAVLDRWREEVRKDPMSKESGDAS